MADDIKSLANRIQELEKKHNELARKVNDNEVRQKLQALQIQALQKDGVGYDNRIKSVESK